MRLFFKLVFSPGWRLMFYSHRCAHGRLNGPIDLRRNWSEVEDETTFRYAHAEIRTQVVVICGPTRYQLDHGDDPYSLMEKTSYCLSIRKGWVMEAFHEIHSRLWCMEILEAQHVQWLLKETKLGALYLSLYCQRDNSTANLFFYTETVYLSLGPFAFWFCKLFRWETGYRWDRCSYQMDRRSSRIWFI